MDQIIKESLEETLSVLNARSLLTYDSGKTFPMHPLKKRVLHIFHYQTFSERVKKFFERIYFLCRGIREDRLHIKTETKA